MSLAFCSFVRLPASRAGLVLQVCVCYIGSSLTFLVRRLVPRDFKAFHFGVIAQSIQQFYAMGLVTHSDRYRPAFLASVVESAFACERRRTSRMQRTGGSLGS
jgi:hypothetical protein